MAASTRRFARTGVPEFFEDLRGAYSVTVLQASSNAEPLPLRAVLPEADAVVLVARSGRTGEDSLRRLVAEVEAHGRTCLGVVLVGVPERRRVLLRTTWRPSDEEHPEVPSPAAAPAATGPAPGGPSVRP